VISRNAGRGGSTGAAATVGAGAGAGAADDTLDDGAAVFDSAGRDGRGRAGAGRGAGAAGGAAGCAAGASGAGAGAAAGGGAAGSVFGCVVSVLLPEQPAAIAELSRAAANQCFVIIVTSGWGSFQGSGRSKLRQVLSVFG